MIVGEVLAVIFIFGMSGRQVATWGKKNLPQPWFSTVEDSQMERNQ